MTKNAMLVVDDSDFLHTLVRTCLEPEPLVIHSAYDGDSAMSAAMELSPRVVLLDVNIPGPDGFEVCRRLKSDPKTIPAAILFLTADSSSDNRSKGLELGAVDYITKPCDPRKLRARVRAALRSQLRQERSLLVDTLTGLWNESYLSEHVAAELSWADRSGSSLACITADIVPLAQSDENYGNVAGEEILRAVADIFLRQCRGSEDTVYYCGDRKFAAVLFGTNLAGAERVVERVRAQVEAELIRGDADAIVRCSFSVADGKTQIESHLLDHVVSSARGAKNPSINEFVNEKRPSAA